MSFKSMLETGKKGATYISIKHIPQSDEVLDSMGGLTDVGWTTLYRRILCRFVAIPKREMIFTFDKKNVFAEYFVHLEYLSGVEEGMRITKEDDNRAFKIKLITDWDEDNQYMRLAVVEIGRNA